MSRTSARRAPKGPLLSLAACALTILASSAGNVARADSTSSTPPKPSSFAPHHTRSRVYGTPVSKPILHKRTKRKPPAPPPTGPAEPIK